ncbi:MAG: cytochrome c3 family protein [Candidatus Sumerlaeota bacterium]|nr:cytochrome c3 family protein [Candidatus Sumerlaeota bacterium]
MRVSHDFRILLCGALAWLAAGLAAAALKTGAVHPPPASKAAKAKPTQETKDIVLGPSCITSECHADMGKAKFLHGPMNLKQCDPCHKPIQNRHEFQPMPEGPALCLTCHEIAPKKKVVHEPFQKDCQACHDPHESDDRYFVKGGTGVEGCDRCHDDVRKGLPLLHGPVAVGECVACHSPHQSDNASLLVDPPGKMCFACHVDMEQRLKSAVSVHKPAQDNCTGCHSPHGGSHEFFVARSGRDLCAQCHEDFLKQIDQFKYTHQPMTEGKTCETCHDAHASNQQALVKGRVEDLCLGCHDKPIAMEGKTVPSIAEQIQNAKFLHGPLRQGNCIACHLAHGSDFAKLLNKAFPASFYAPFQPAAYDLCFECHDKQIVLHKESAEDGFRNGDQDLHYLHVNQQKGRTCRACHHEHASNQPFDIRSSVPFGRWTMPVEYAKTDTGGGCLTGCHVEYRYDRANPVQNPKEAKTK